jgi:hypothetical protein
MKPLQIANNLRLIAAALEKSERPSKSLVIKDIRRVLAILLYPTRPYRKLAPDPNRAEKSIQLDGVKAVNLDPSFPTFRFKGKYTDPTTGQEHEFEYDISVEMDGRDADAQHVSGMDIGNEIDMADVMDDFFNDIYKTPEYQDLVKSLGRYRPT